MANNEQVIKVVLTPAGSEWSAEREYERLDYISNGKEVWVSIKVDATTGKNVGHPLTDTAWWNKCIDLSEAESLAAAATVAANAAATTANKAAQAAKDAKTAVEAAVSEANKATEETKKATSSALAVTGKANVAANAAEKVNADIDGNIFFVINRNGEVKTLDFAKWDLEETVNITVSTSVEGVSVNGITINVFLNGGTTPTRYTTNAEGKVSFVVPRGTIYKVAFQEFVNCDPIPSYTYTSALKVRDINVEYKARSSSNDAKANVTVRKIENATTSPFAGIQVTCKVKGGGTSVSQTDDNGKVSFVVPYGKEYEVTAEAAEGYYAIRGEYTKTGVADVPEHNLYFTLYPSTSGVFIIDASGNQYTSEEWKAAGKSSDEAKLIKVATQNLLKNGAFFGFSPSYIQTGSYPSHQWCNPVLLFENISSNGNNVNDALYYKGAESSKIIREEALEKGVSIPAFNYANEQTVEINGEVRNGYVPSLGQLSEVGANRGLVDEIMKMLYGSTAKLFTAFLAGFAWSSTQNGATNAWGYSSSVGGNDKSNRNYVLPAFAC